MEGGWEGPAFYAAGKVEPPSWHSAAAGRSQYSTPSPLHAPLLSNFPLTQGIASPHIFLLPLPSPLQPLELRLPNAVPWLLERVPPFEAVGLQRFLVQPAGACVWGCSVFGYMRVCGGARCTLLHRIVCGSGVFCLEAACNICRLVVVVGGAGGAGGLLIG